LPGLLFWELPDFLAKKKFSLEVKNKNFSKKKRVFLRCCSIKI